MEGGVEGIPLSFVLRVRHHCDSSQ